MPKKILVIGNSPIPQENPSKLTCPEIRTGIICEHLKDKGNLMLLGIREESYYVEKNLPDIFKSNDFDFKYYSINKKVFRKYRPILDIIHNFSPDVMIGINTFPSYYAAISGLKVPFWADLNGSAMMEAQLKSYREKDETFIHEFWEIEKTIIQRADKLSVVSTPQKFELVGELGGIGRLNGINAGYEFVSVIPEPVFNDGFENYSKSLDKRRFFKDDDFVILWLGGYNYWTDIDFLYEILTGSMRRNKKIKFLSVGGSIETQKNKIFLQFKNKALNSEFADNFKFFDNILTSDLSVFYNEADAGINIDTDSYETMFGARYRITDMLRHGLPIVSTRGSEITQIIEKEKLGFISDIGDIDSMIENILQISANTKEYLNSFNEKTTRFALKEFSPDVVLKPLSEWILHSEMSPDHNVIVGYNFWVNLFKKIRTFLRLLNSPTRLGEVLKRKVSAFIKG